MKIYGDRNNRRSDEVFFDSLVGTDYWVKVSSCYADSYWAHIIDSGEDDEGKWYTIAYASPNEEGRMPPYLVDLAFLYNDTDWIHAKDMHLVKPIQLYHEDELWIDGEEDEDEDEYWD